MAGVGWGAQGWVEASHGWSGVCRGGGGWSWLHWSGVCKGSGTEGER